MAEPQKYQWHVAIKKDPSALVPDDPYVRALATRLGWKVNTLIARVEKALPQRIEQSIFLNLTVDWRVPVHPETFRDIYLYFTNGQWLADHDLEDREVEPNLYVNKGERIIENLSLVLGLLHWEKEHGYPIGWRTATNLIWAYGEHAEEILSVIAESLEEVMEVRGMKMPERKAFAVIAKAIATRAANTGEECSAPNVACADDILELLSPIPSSPFWNESNGDDVDNAQGGGDELP